MKKQSEETEKKTKEGTSEEDRIKEEIEKLKRNWLRYKLSRKNLNKLRKL